MSARRKRMKEQSYRELFEYDLDGVLSLDLQGRFISANEPCRELLGYGVEELLGTAFVHLVIPQDSKKISESFSNAAGGEPQSVETTVIHKNDNRLKLHLTIVPIMVEEETVGVSMVVRELTERRKLEEQLLNEALYDPLTDLLNRRLFADRLEHALDRLIRSEGSVALLLLDLDNFKLINDGFGHVVGDEVLKSVGKLLQSSLRPADTAARLGGDEFAILIEDNSQTSNAMWMAERILEKLREPVSLQGRELPITASIGIALATTAHHDDPEELLREADLAMYRAKSKGKNRCEAYDPSLVSALLECPESLSRDLADSFLKREFKVYYQPLVALETDAIVGVEALLRWEHPESGLVLPDQFLPLMEQSGLIMPVGQWMLEKACHTVRGWQAQYPGGSPLKLSANLSVRQLQRPDLVQEIVATLRRTKLSPSSLQLEVTESLMLGDEETGFQKLRQLRDLGVGVTIDDFGTGYSSLRLLRRLPKDEVKIDKSFVDGLGIDAEDTAIVKTIVELAHDLGMRVTAEGVESLQQAAYLREIGCDLAQGNYFAQPSSSETTRAHLELALGNR